MKYINLMGEEVDTATFKKTNPMVKAFGNGPTDKRCKDCAHIIRKTFAKIYYKCELRGNTNGPATDHRVNWPSCGKFKTIAI